MDWASSKNYEKRECDFRLCRTLFNHSIKEPWIFFTNKMNKKNSQYMLFRTTVFKLKLCIMKFDDFIPESMAFIHLMTRWIYLNELRNEGKEISYEVLMKLKIHRPKPAVLTGKKCRVKTMELQSTKCLHCKEKY